MMRKPTIENKYNLKFNDIQKLKIGDREKIVEPIFWRNNAVKAWCITKTTAKNRKDSEFGTYSDFWLGVYDEADKVRVNCSCYGGMATYRFKEFFNAKDIENELDLRIQEILLETVNYLIDNSILKIED